MRNISRSLITSLLALTAIALIACASPPAEENKNDGASGSQPGSDSSQPKVANEGTPLSQQSEGTGSIQVTSDPAGAHIILIEEDEAGAGAPKPRGVTPATLTELAEGKYIVHLERPGYKFFQKNVKVVANQTAKVKAKLRKE